jgi:DNA-binding beta-propeller fold protein YncE
MARFSIFILGLLVAVQGSACGPAGDDTGDGDADADGDGDACTDLDGDGAGIGDACAADDCDDTDPGTTSECGEACDARPDRRGCPCDTGAVQPCYRGPEGSGDSGACEAGIQQCEGRVWGACEGQVLPGVEACNGLDDDCDGELDDGVLSDCGDCNADCITDCVGVDCDLVFDPDEGRSVVADPSGGLTLGGQTGIANKVIWIANSSEGTVSKVNTETRIEEGRYRVGPGQWSDPSRSTVNPHGDVVSILRSGGGATKILASECSDQNGDGFDTSGGPDDILEWGEDDCVVWHLDGIPGARGSAVEIRAELDAGVHEYVWVGSLDQGIIYELDSEQGEFTGREIDQVSPYGAALGPGGMLWTFTASWGGLARFDTTTLDRTEFAFPAGEGPYGITVDGEGRVWIGGSVARFDPESEEWESPAANVSGGGIAVDGNGDAWTGEMGSAWHVDGETLEATAIPGSGGHGWAVDFDGFAWAIEWNGGATVVDPETLEVDERVTGFVGPYTYSDMTGFQLVNATNPVGTFPHIFQACEGSDSVHWSHLTCDADVPAGTTVSFRGRIADSAEALQAAQWVDLASLPTEECPIDLDAVFTRAGLPIDAVSRHFFQVEATLASANRESRPVLMSMGVDFSCEGVFE